MKLLKNKINKLAEMSEAFNWKNGSKKHDSLELTFGGHSPTWDTWVNDIENILKLTVKPNSEPFVYFKAANNSKVKGNSEDKFEFAKDSYIKALNALISLIDEGDIFNELLVSGPPKKINNPNGSPEKIKASSSLVPRNNKVFIVHGHDNALEIELALFLAQIGIKPIYLHGEIDGEQSIIEKLEANSDVSYAFILLTPDEVLYTIEQSSVVDVDRKKVIRARPNVIFEFGYLVAKLGIKNVCVLHKGDVDIPTNLSGFIYKKVDDNIDEIGLFLIKEIKAAGFKPEL
ncbi:TIR domain-containing protein [Colwellia hornerae]|uniref:TIR domain-containing protein n=1 Tax=Colwellia hornerae TaxID=89402 RepID=UPI0014787E14|nr:nucleotide-binding protein [Colwellia hornerae]